MSFNIGLSGIQAASSGLNVTGNNIANAGTVGFKQSRAEFADVYAASVLGSGSNPQGSGVLLSDVSQMFKQGNIDSTNSVLDLAINGNGFFVTSNNGAISYTRAGYFNTDKQDFIVDNNGYRLQGYAVGPNGQLQNGVVTDLKVERANCGAAGHLEHPAVVQPQLDAEAADRDAVRSVRRRYLQLVLFAGHL